MTQKHAQDAQRIKGPSNRICERKLPANSGFRIVPEASIYVQKNIQYLKKVLRIFEENGGAEAPRVWLDFVLPPLAKPEVETR